MKTRQSIIFCVFLVAVIVCFFSCHVAIHPAIADINSSRQYKTIVVDAGHGGEDGGAEALSGVSESAINLSISKKLEQLLALCGTRCEMIRSEDVSVCTEGNSIRERKISDLKQRVNISNSINDAILISIHQNHFPQQQYSGAQVFYAPTAGSKQLAAYTQTQLREVLNPSNSREIKKADSVFLMEKIRCTGILVECGFLSNPQEDLLLQNNTYQRKLVCALASALMQYIESEVYQLEV